jgi:hypothetical protein
MTQPDPSAQSGTGSAQGGVTDTGQGTGAPLDPNAQSGAVDPSGTGQQQTPPVATVSQAEYDALKSRLIAADKTRTEAQDQLRQLLEKDLPEQEKLKKALDEAAASRDANAAALRETRLENAFLKDNKFKWHDPTTALKLADLSKVEIQDDGTVLNLTAALDALAKSHPFLIDSTPAADPPRGSTGAPAGGRASDTNQDMKVMANRVPALRTRGIGS